MEASAHVSQGLRGILIYCADYRCSHSLAISGDALPDDMRLSDLWSRLLLFTSHPVAPGSVKPHSQWQQSCHDK
jgi:hypothetical protein